MPQTHRNLAPRDPYAGQLVRLAPSLVAAAAQLLSHLTGPELAGVLLAAAAAAVLLARPRRAMPGIVGWVSYRGSGGHRPPRTPPRETRWPPVRR
jgi:hypothetical protein